MRQVQPRPTQLSIIEEFIGLPQEKRWRVSDSLADKEGFRHNVYWINGEQYRGYWSHNKKDGIGIHVYKNGDRYEGEWRNGRKEGQGTLWVPTPEGKYKALYQGMWKNGKWHGKGVTFGTNREKYEGEFSNGKRCGLGTQRCYVNDKLEVYTGQWFNDKREGLGVLHLANGDYYEGPFSNGMKEGRGILFYADGCSRYEGLWHEDVPIAGTYKRETTNPEQGLPLLEVKNSDTLAEDIINHKVTKIASIKMP